MVKLLAILTLERQLFPSDPRAVMKTTERLNDPKPEERPSTASSPKFQEALVYAAQAHAGQLRKGTQIPYLSHLLAVTAIALENGATDDQAIAALLHDAVEDAGGKPRLADIEARFGKAVASIVAGCTDTDEVPKPPWRERKTAYVAHVRQAPISVKLVAAADKLHNARAILSDYRAIGDTLWTRFNGGKEGTLWYHRAMVGAFTEPRLRPLAEDLDAAVTELERLAHNSKPVLEPPSTRN
jgi:(p)ppGpp synthase/HD superfamily hydrolase